MLPVEFARLSDGGRLTLVLLHGARPVQTLWARMPQADLEEAVLALRMREGAKCKPTPAKNIACLSRAEGNDVSRVIAEWAKSQGLADVIWTALPPQWDGNRGQAPTLDQALGYLSGLTGDLEADAKEYVERAPASIRTRYRDAFEKELGWRSAPAEPG